MKIATTLLLLLPSFLLVAPGSSTDAEHEAVERAVLDYLEGLYEVKPELIERSVHPDLRKVGFGRWGDQTEYQGPFPMTYTELHQLAGKWNAAGDQITETSPRKVEVHEVLDQTASAKLTAEWGIDYMHLAKYDGKWKIVNVLWQSHPEEGAEAGNSDG